MGTDRRSRHLGWVLFSIGNALDERDGRASSNRTVHRPFMTTRLIKFFTRPFHTRVHFVEVSISSAKKPAKPKEILGRHPSHLKSIGERSTDLNERYLELLKLREEVRKLRRSGVDRSGST